MKTIIVGDLHGRYEIAEKVLEAKEDYNVVFVGDYVDSREGISPVDQVKTIKLVLEAIKVSDGRVQGLLGNHELSYMKPEMQCSGYSYEVRNAFNNLDVSPLKNYTWVDGDGKFQYSDHSQALDGVFAPHIAEQNQNAYYWAFEGNSQNKVKPLVIPIQQLQCDVLIDPNARLIKFESGDFIKDYIDSPFSPIESRHHRHNGGIKPPRQRSALMICSTSYISCR